MCPKEALFGGYIQLELDVRNPNTTTSFRTLTTPFTNSFENSTAFEQYTKNTSNGIPQTPPPGSSSQS